MKRTLKKALALILSVVMLMSLTSVGMVAFAESQPEPYEAELKVGSSVVVPMTEWGTAAYLTVVPEKTDIYVFSSDNEDGYSEVYATLLNENGNRLTEAGRAHMANANFRFGYKLEAGKTYSLRIDMSSKMSDTITVELSASEIQEIVITGTPNIVENTNGYLSSAEEDFYNYDWEWSNSFSYNVVFKDGYIMEHSGNDGFAYNNVWYEIETDDNQYEEHWYAGNTYNATISILGVSATVPVTITESPLKNVVFEPVEIIEKTNGYYQDGSEGPENKYFYYNWENKLKYTAYFNDGTAVKGEGTSFEYNGDFYSLEHTYVQYYNPFTVGNTYSIPVSVMGKTFNASVSIVETPVESFDLTSKITLIENLDGSLQDHNPNDIWFNYEWQNCIDYTLTLKDGTVYTIEENGLNGIEYNGEYYSFTYGSTQHSEHWNVGETHTVTLSILGVEKEIEVTVAENPVTSVTVNPVTIREGRNGYTSTNPNGESVFIYYWINNLEYTVNFEDGSSANFKGQNYSYNGRNYIIRYDNFKQYENPFVLGENKVTLNIFGKEVEVTVNVVSSPVAKVTIDPLVIKEYTNGYFNSDESGNKWFYYNWYHKNLTYTVEMNDGTVIKADLNNGFNYKDEFYNLSFGSYDFDQYETHMYAGNTYTVPATLDGKPCEIQIVIVGEQESDGFTYLVQNGTAIITGYTGSEKVVNIPSTLGGNTVVGITEIYDWEDDEYETNVITELTIPDTVTMLSDTAFEYIENLEVLNLGKGVSEIQNDWFIYLSKLKEINVSKENPYLCSVDGIVYNKEITKLVALPVAKKGTFKVPATITDLEVFFEHSFLYSNIELDLSNNPAGYKKVDGVIYNADMTKVLLCDKNKTGSYVMPDTVTEIAQEAFAGSKIEKVTVSKNVTALVYGEFADCFNLTSVTLPEGLTDIGFGTFRKCKALESITLPESLNWISTLSFAESGIKNITIPANVEYVGDEGFAGSALESIVISNGVQAIGSYCFNDSNLKSLVLPDSIQYLGYGACYGTPLKSVTLSRNEDFNSIGSQTFYSTDLVSVVVPENITYIGENAFADSVLLTDIDVECAEVYYDIGAFANCPLKEINLKEGTVCIADHAFSGNKATSVKIPDSVTYITYYSFANSENLADIDVPDTLEGLCGYAFEGSAWLNNQKDGVVYLENYLYGYKGKMPKNTEITVEEGTKLIADYAFESEQYLTKIHIPASVEHIGEFAFYDCLALSEITVDEDSEYFYVENDILFSTDGEVIWAKPTEVTYLSGLITEFEYGAPFGFEMEVYGHVATASPEIEHYIEAFWSTWFDLPMSEVVSGYDPYKVGTQTVTIHLGCVDYEYEVTVNEKTAPAGDANGDGVVNVKDIADLKKFLVELLSEEDAAALKGDVNEDGTVNVSDLAQLKKIVAGLM